MLNDHKQVKIAILDLYEGAPNEGMRCIRQLLKTYASEKKIDITYEEFDVRLDKKVPGLNFDLYISTGGPGSPLGEEDAEWENIYFNWIGSIEHYNSSDDNAAKKHVLFICHSFQMACRYFEVGNVSKRKSTAFGVFPVHIVGEGKQEPLFSGLPDPFYAVDSRDYQVVEPDYGKIETMGASVLAIEKERPHVPLERAVMALRFNDYMLGTQFHPEADAEGMTMYLQRQDKKDMVIENHGLHKWQSMIDHLNDPDKISCTYSHVIPNFLDQAIKAQWNGF
ncbi:MAG: homoserine O-succinyltransferase [Chitinophagaceae bacterium]|nr:homoserine O-succinyltransferase [Chitinophagaceae bacterium]